MKATESAIEIKIEEHYTFFKNNLVQSFPERSEASRQ